MLNETALNTLFLEARTFSGWRDLPVSDEQLRQIYDLMKWGPTSANCSPARIVFVKSSEAKEKLLACMNPGNIEKTKTAPVTAIIGMDMEFYEKLPRLFPHNPDARSWFAGNQANIETTAMRNSSLQGGYFILAARAVGLDCAPWACVKAYKRKDTGGAGTTIKVNFVCSLGYGDTSKLHPRGRRLAFDETCKIV